MEADRARWDERWTGSGTDPQRVVAIAPDVVEAHPALLEQLPTSGRALDLACGVGAQSVWLAARGLTVTALDVSPVAVDIATAAATRRGLDVQASVWDTDEGLPVDLDELAIIVCQRYRAQHLYRELAHRLRPGGVLILTVLSAVGLDGTPGPFHAPAGELTDAFQPMVDDGSIDVLVDEEKDGQASIVVRRRPA